MSFMRTVVAFLAVLASSASLLSVLKYGSWFWWAAALSGAIFGINAGLRAALRKTGYVWIARPAALLFAAIIMLRLATPSEMIAGIIPTRDALIQLGAHLREATEVIRYSPPPVTANVGLMLMALVAVTVVATLVDLLAIQAHAPAIAVLPLIALWTPAVILGREISLSLGLASLLTWLLLIALEPSPSRAPSGRPSHIVGGLIGVTSVFLLTGLVGLPWAENWGVWRSVSVGKNEPTTSVITAGNPIQLADGVELSHILGERSDETVLRYKPVGAAPSVLRLRVMSDYEDGKWAPATDLTAGEPMPPAGLSDHQTAQQSMLEVEHTGLIERFGVSGGNTVGLASDPSIWALTNDTNELVNRAGTINQPYQVVWSPPEFTSRDLIAAPASGYVNPRWLETAPDLPRSFYTELERAKGEAKTPYETALNIQNWFREKGDYEYEVTNDEVTGSALEDFFITRTGFCVHYATAMTLMLREEGIPARVAVGFLPGSRRAGGWYEVAANRAHAWPEVYFAEYGWVRFEPTPAQQTGRPPQWARTGDPATGTATVDASPTASRSEPAPIETNSSAPSSPTSDPGTRDKGSGFLNSGRLWIVVAAGGAVLAALGWTLARRRENRRAQTRQTKWDHARKIIAAVAPDAVAEHWSPARSPRQVASALAPYLSSELGQRLHELAEKLEDLAFAPPSIHTRASRRRPKSELAEIDAQLDALRAATRAANKR